MGVVLVVSVVVVVWMVAMVRAMGAVRRWRQREEEEVGKELAAVRRHIGPRQDAQSPQRALNRKVQVRGRQPTLLQRGGGGGGFAVGGC